MVVEQTGLFPTGSSPASANVIRFEILFLFPIRDRSFFHPFVVERRSKTSLHSISSLPHHSSVLRSIDSYAMCIDRWYVTLVQDHDFFFLFFFFFFCCLRICASVVTNYDDEYTKKVRNIIFFLFVAMILDASLFSATIRVLYLRAKIDQKQWEWYTRNATSAPSCSPPHIPNRWSRFLRHNPFLYHLYKYICDAWIFSLIFLCNQFVSRVFVGIISPRFSFFNLLEKRHAYLIVSFLTRIHWYIIEDRLWHENRWIFSFSFYFIRLEWHSI